MGLLLLLRQSRRSHPQRETSIFAAFDLAPSLLSIANIATPEGTHFDGENLGDVLLGRSSASRRAPIFWRRPPDRKTASPKLPERLPDLAMRDGQWKFLCDYDGSKPQLYNLAQDRSESKNLATQNADTVNRMSAALLKWHQTMPPDHGPALGASSP